MSRQRSVRYNGEWVVLEGYDPTTPTFIVGDRIGSNAGSYSWSYPAEAQAGDLVVAFIANDASAASSMTGSDGGWKAEAYNNTSNPLLVVSKRVEAANLGTDITLTMSGSTNALCYGLFRNTSGVSADMVSSIVTTSNSTFTVTPATTPRDNCLSLAIGVQRIQGSGGGVGDFKHTVNNGWTACTGASRWYPAITVAYYAMDTAGTPPTPTFTRSQSAHSQACAQLGITLLPALL